MLVTRGLGWYADLADCVDKFAAYGDTIITILENVDKYRKIYPQPKGLCGGIWDMGIGASLAGLVFILLSDKAVM